MEGKFDRFAVVSHMFQKMSQTVLKFTDSLQLNEKNVYELNLKN